MWGPIKQTISSKDYSLTTTQTWGIKSTWTSWVNKLSITRKGEKIKSKRWGTMQSMLKWINSRRIWKLSKSKCTKSNSILRWELRLHTEQQVTWPELRSKWIRTIWWLGRNMTTNSTLWFQACRPTNSSLNLDQRSHLWVHLQRQEILLEAQVSWLMWKRKKFSERTRRDWQLMDSLICKKATSPNHKTEGWHHSKQVCRPQFSSLTSLEDQVASLQANSKAPINLTKRLPFSKQNHRLRTCFHRTADK